MSLPISACPELHSQRLHQLHFAQAVAGAQLVLRHAIGIQPAGQGPLVENRHRESVPPQFRRAASDAGPPPTHATFGAPGCTAGAASCAPRA